MATHYTYLDQVIPPATEAAQSQQKFIASIVLVATMLFIGAFAAKRIKGRAGIEENIVPDEKFSLFGFCDVLIETFIRYHDSVLGKDNRKHIPFNATIFFFLFAANLIGLVPGMPAITTTVWVNWGMAFVVLIYFNVMGMRAQGVANYWKHFLGPSGLPAVLAILMPLLMFPLEILSVIILRPFVLNLRLYWNITADHIVLHSFTDMLSNVPGLGWLPLATPFYFVGTFVSFMQAFVFTTLTMIYILLAVQHDEEH